MRHVGVVGLTVSASSSNRVRPESSAARCFQRRHQRAVVDVVAELRRGRFRRTRTAPPARGSGGRYRRPGASTCSAAALSLAARPDIEPLEQIDGAAQQRRGAIVGIGRAAGEQGRLARRLPPARSPPQARRDRRRSRRRHRCLDASFIPGQLTFPAAFSSPASRCKCFRQFTRRNAATADVQIERDS